MGVRYFCELGALSIFRNPTTTPFGRKVTAVEEKQTEAELYQAQKQLG